MSDANDEPLLEPEARLLADLGRALGPDDPPPGLLARAEGLLAFMGIDQELVQLLDAEVETVGSRGTATGDRLVFELGDGSVSLEVGSDGVLLVGQLISGDVVEVALEGLDGVLAASAVDELGRFSLRSAPAGPVRLRLHGGSGRRLATDWFLL